MPRTPERRNFERVSIPSAAGVYAMSPEGQRLGHITMLGRGGFLLATERQFKTGQSGAFVLVDEKEGIHTSVRAIARYNSQDGVGFEFQDLNTDAAVEVGVVIGKHHTAGEA